MKTFSILKLSVFFIASAIISSCQKENRPGERDKGISKENLEKQVKPLPFKGVFTTNFNFVPDIAGGWTPPNPAPAWYPGEGSGNVTHMGTCLTYFNQYATFGAAGLQSVGAPVNLFFSVPLSVAGFTVPNTVSTIYYTAHGQSVWSKAIGISVTTPVSPTRVELVEIAENVRVKIIRSTIADVRSKTEPSDAKSKADNDDDKK